MTHGMHSRAYPSVILASQGQGSPPHEAASGAGNVDQAVI